MQLLLLPGTLCDAELWEPQVCSLSDRAHPRVVDLARDDSISAMAARTLRAAPARFLLAGLSMGAIVAFEIMRRSPERVLGLALLNTNPAAPEAQQIEAWQEEIGMVERGHFRTLVEDRWIPSLLSASGSHGLSLEHTIRTMALRTGPGGYIGQLRAQIARRESWSSLGMITCPTLILGGRQDTLCPPPLQQAMQAALPNSHLAIVEDCGHLSTLEQPETVTVLLRAWVETTHASLRPAANVSLRGHHA